MAALWAGRICSKLPTGAALRLFSVSVMSEKSGMAWLLFDVGYAGFKPAFSVDELLAVRRLLQGAEAVGGDHLHTLRGRVHQPVQGCQQVRKTVTGNKTIQPAVQLPHQIRRRSQLQRFQPLVKLVDALNVDTAMAAAAIHFLQHRYFCFAAKITQAQVQFAEQELVVAGRLAKGICLGRCCARSPTRNPVLRANSPPSSHLRRRLRVSVSSLSARSLP